MALRVHGLNWFKDEPAAPLENSRTAHRRESGHCVCMDPLDALDVLLLHRLAAGLPVTEQPYADVAAELGCTERDVIGCLQRLLASGAVRSFGAMPAPSNPPRKRLLCALQVADERFGNVAEALRALPGVLHDVRREHRMNMWLTVEAASAAELRATCARIEALTGLRLFRFPRQKSFFPKLRLRAIHGARCRPRSTVA